MQFLKGWKTVGFNLLALLLPLLEASRLSDYLNDGQMIWYILFLIFGNLILRVWFTKTPIGKKY